MAKKRKIKVVIRKLGREKAFGLSCSSEHRIELDPRVRPKFFLDSIFHELLHEIFNEELSESKVIKIAKIFTDVTWALGFRRIYDENKSMEPRKINRKKDIENKKIYD